MKRLRSLTTLTASEMARAITAGEATSSEIVADCLERISERQPEIGAWAAVDRRKALEAARAADRRASGPVRGVPFAVKDVIDTLDLPTQMGSPIYAGWQQIADAACVAIVRAAGAVLLGKTVTAEFAGSTPTKTRNPLNPGRTPGGSSSGSAAAVADFQVPIAFGTQTGGSVLRPASFCGLFGFKPTFGSFNTAGIKSAAFSFDTIGLIARSLDDIELFTSILTNGSFSAPSVSASPPRIAVARTHLWHTADDDTRAAVERSAATLASSGAISEAELPPDFAELTSRRAVINAYERAHALAHEWRTRRMQLSPQSVAICEAGFQLTRAEYIEALRFAEDMRQRIAATFRDIDVLLTPCVPGEAPDGLDHAGDPRLQELWTMLHNPTITLPLHRGPTGMPVGIQLVAARYDEHALFAAARWICRQIAPADIRAAINPAEA